MDFITNIVVASIVILVFEFAFRAGVYLGVKESENKDEVKPGIRKPFLIALGVAFLFF